MATNKYDNQLIKKFSVLKQKLTKAEKRIAAIVNDFLTNPQLSKSYWTSINTALNKEYKYILDISREWANIEIPKQYRFVIKEQMAKVKKLKSITKEAKSTTSQLLKSNKVIGMQAVLAQAAIDDITTGLLQGRKNINKLITATRQTLISESTINRSLMSSIQSGNISVSSILSRQGTVANRLLKANEGNRYMQIIDKNGNPRTYRITYYSEMVYRSAWHEAQSQAVKTVANNYDTDLVRVSNHNTTTEICQQYEGKVFSISGKSKDFPVLDQSPPFHVNCLHYLTVTFEESLKVQGVYEDYSKFSKGQINTPPGQTGFVPVKERNKIANQTIADTKNTIKYQKATPKQKRNLIRDNVSKAIGKAAA